MSKGPRELLACYTPPAIMNKVWLTLLAVVLGGYWLLSRPEAMGAGPPIDWSREPVQSKADRAAFSIDTDEGKVTIEPQAEFEVRGVVAAAERYRADGGAFLSPVDLVLTWGKLPEEPFKSKVSYSQMTRYYFWRTPSADLDLNYIQSHSSNMHMIPASKNVRRALLAVGTEDPVRIRGLLVNAASEEGFTWGSSLSREDSGPGACELIWVEEIQIKHRIYR
jgi:hypothetical protein